MPGTPTPGRMAIPADLADMQRQIRALSSQQTQVITDPTGATGDPAHGNATVVIGALQQITGLPGFGVALWGGATWSTVMQTADPGNFKSYAFRGGMTIVPHMVVGVGFTGVSRTGVGTYVLTHDTCTGWGYLIAAVSTQGNSAAGSTANFTPLTATTSQVDIFNAAGARIDGEFITLVGTG